MDGCEIHVVPMYVYAHCMSNNNKGTREVQQTCLVDPSCKISSTLALYKILCRQFRSQSKISFHYFTLYWKWKILLVKRDNHKSVLLFMKIVLILCKLLISISGSGRHLKEYLGPSKCIYTEIMPMRLRPNNFSSDRLSISRFYKCTHTHTHSYSLQVELNSEGSILFLQDIYEQVVIRRI